METSGPNNVTVSTVDEVEDTDTTVEIKIKTLDSQTYTLRVNKCVPVPALKEQIATVTGILSEQQRLICRGRVLRDDQLLSAYHVEDGHTLHLVSRQPIPSSPSVPSVSAMGSEAFSLDSTGTHNRGNHVAHSIVFEAVNIDQGDRSPSSVSRILASVFNAIASAGIGTGNSRTDLMETGPERLERVPDNTGISDAPHPQPSQVAPRADADSRQPAFRFPSAVNLGFQQPAVIPDSVTTIHQYIHHMREAFRDSGSDPNNNLEGSDAHISEGQNHGFQSRPVSGQGTLPRPASLAEILLSARELLVDQAGGRLSQLARQLENQESMTDPLVRANVQSSALRSGYLLQNLGSLLLELGRTTMTLRMGQIPAEAVVNAGPALYISASGPSPMMVQPAPFYPGSSFGVHMGTANSVPGLEGQPLASAHLPRNTDIRIHAGHMNPVASVDLGEQTGAQQAQLQTDSVRNSPVANFIHQAFSSGTTGSSSFTGEPGVRVLPIRTVVAVPAGISRSPSDSSGRPTGVFYPLFARIQRQNSGNVNEARGSQSTTEPHHGGPETDQQPILESSMTVQLPTNPMPIISGMSASTNESSEYQGPARIFISSQGPPTINNNTISQSHDWQETGQGSAAQMLSRLDQFLRNALTGEENNVTDHHDPAADSATNQADIVRSSEEQGAYVDGEDQGIFFSNLVRQIMPFISQATAAVPDISPTNPISSTDQTERESSTDPSSSRRDRDPSDAPNPKRPKRD